MKTRAERNKARYATPEGKAAAIAASRTRYATPEGRAAQKATNQAWSVTEEGISSRKASALRERCKRVGITVEYYNSLHKKCSLRGCDAIEPGRRGDWHLDHEHVEGFENLPFEERGKYFRGLLCNAHNTGLGMFNDSAEELMGAIAYLSQHRDKNFYAGKEIYCGI